MAGVAADFVDSGDCVGRPLSAATVQPAMADIALALSFRFGPDDILCFTVAGGMGFPIGRFDTKQSPAESRSRRAKRFCGFPRKRGSRGQAIGFRIQSTSFSVANTAEGIKFDVIGSRGGTCIASRCCRTNLVRRLSAHGGLPRADVDGGSGAFKAAAASLRSRKRTADSPCRTNRRPIRDEERSGSCYVGGNFRADGDWSTKTPHVDIGRAAG